MKTLVAFYSRTGTTKKVANEIAKNLKADIDEIIDKKDRSGIIGWLGAGKDVLFKKPTEIKTKKDPSKYDLVVVGTPIWVGAMVPAVKAYLSKNNFKKVAFFCTCADRQVKAFKEMQELSKKPLATLELKTISKEKIKEFCKQ